MAAKELNTANGQGSQAVTNKSNGFMNRFFGKTDTQNHQEEPKTEDDANDLQEYHNPMLGINQEYFITDVN